MKRVSLSALLGLACLALTVTTAPAAEPVERGFLNRIYTDPEGKAHAFVVFVPAKFEPGSPPPALLCLHGAGDGGTNNINQIMVGLGPAIWKRKSWFPFVTVFPQCRTGSNWNADGLDAQWALAMLKQTQTEFGTDPDRVYLTGLSMGGTGTWSIATKDPSAWAAIVPMCAGPNLAKVDKFIAARLPVWNFCGDKDREGIVKANRDMQEALTQAGVNSKYTEYPGVGHNCWDEAYGTDALYKWLLQQARSKNRK